MGRFQAMAFRTAARLLATYLVALCLLATPPSALAVEQAQEFLEALRQRGYYDTALEYLNRAEMSKLTPVEFRQVVLLERGITLVEAAKRNRDFALREKQLDQAHAAIQEFIRTRATHPRADNAKNQLANVVAERARMKLEQAEKSDNSALRVEASNLFDAAYKLFATRQNELRDRLSRMKKVFDPKREKQEIELRDQLRTDYLQAQLLSAAILEESAETVSHDDPKYKEILERASREYEAIYEKYRTRLAGLYAKMYRGRCLSKMGNRKDALADFEDLLENEDGPDALRTLKTRALLLAMDAWMHPDQNKYMVATQRGSEWVDTVRPNESRTLDWLSLRLKLARALKVKAGEMKKEKANDPAAGRTIVTARKLATFVSRVSGEYQKPARELLVELRGGDSENAADRPLPKNFVEAKARGKEALDSIQTAGLILRRVPERLQTEKDPEVKKELQAQIDEANKTLANAHKDAFEMFRLSLTLVDKDTELTEINAVRYFLCYLYYSRGDYFDAAVLGEFVARRYPDSAGARQCAKIALAAYVKLHGQNKSGQREFETSRIVATAEYIAEKWPDQVEAEEALNTLIPFMIQDRQLDKAQKYLERIPTESPKRGDAELQTGKAMWASYLGGMREVKRWETDGAPDGVNVAARKAELEDLKKRSQAVLKDGVDRMRGGATNTTLATAALSLAQVYLDSGQAPQAVLLLEDAKIGPLTLAKSGHAATKGSDFVELTYKTSLRAYISALPTAKNPNEVMDKARGVMDLLKSEVATDAAGQKKLVSIYISLARDLERMVTLAPPAEKMALSKGFETFLTQVGAEASEFNVINWVAETFYSLGKGLGSGPAVKGYYQKASENYQKILDKKLAKGDLEFQVLMRQAVTKRELLQFNNAMKTFEDILKRKNLMVNVQVEAARTYQDWASRLPKEKDKITLYERAMKGGRRDKRTGKNLIWGWGKLAKMTGGNAKFTDTFHEARVGLARCRYSAGLASSNAAKKNTYLASAYRDIQLTNQLYPDLGGAKWRARYDSLLRSIQKAQGKPVQGLRAFDKKKAAPKKST